MLARPREKQPGCIDRYTVKWHGRSAWEKHNVIVRILAMIDEHDWWIWANISHLHAICSISGPQAFTRNLFATFNLQNSPVLLLYYPHAVYMLLYLYIYVFLLHSYTTNSVSIHSSYVILPKFYLLHACTQPIPLIAHLYSTNTY